MVGFHEYALSNGSDHLCILLGGVMVRRKISGRRGVVDEGFDDARRIGFYVPIY